MFSMQPLGPSRHSQVHRWYRATVEHTYDYIKRFRILGERYRGKISRGGQFGFEHIHNAISVIANLCAYHNRREPHRVHPPVAVFDRA